MQKGGNSHLAWIGATNLKTTRGLSRLSCSLRKRVRFPIVLYKMSTKKIPIFFSTLKDHKTMWLSENRKIRN